MKAPSVTRSWSVCVGLVMCAGVCLYVEWRATAEPAATQPGPDTAESAPDRPMSLQASLDHIMGEYHRVHSSRDDQHYQRAETMFRAAFIRAGGRPTGELVREIVRDLAEQAVIWDRYTRNNVSAGDFAFTMMYRIYWHLTPPDLSAEDAALLDKQQETLYRIMESMPARLTEEFGVPGELDGQVEALCRLAMSHYKSALTSPFLRPSQVPMTDRQFDDLKDAMKKETVRLGNSLSGQLAADRAQWQRDVASLGGADKALPQDFGAVLLDRQLGTCSRYVTFFYGMGMRTYFMPRFADLTSSKQVFLLGLPDTYGVHYNTTNGYLFWAFPKEDTLPAIGPMPQTQ